MKKVISRVVSLALTIALLCSVSLNVFAYSDETVTSGSFSAPLMQPATSLEMSEYNVYAPVFPDQVTAEKILAQCKVMSEFTVGGIQYTTYTSDEIGRYLVDCASINEILSVGHNLYIDYLTTEGDRVFLCYSSEGYENTTVQTADDGCTYFFEDGSGIKYELGHYNMSEAMEKQIDEYIQNGKIEDLCSLSGVITHVDEDGNVIIEENLQEKRGSVSTRSTSNPTMESELLLSLKLDFPMYENKTIETYSKYCSALRKNITIKVTETRNAYVKKNASWGDFIAATALTVITAAMGFQTMSVTVAVLTALGIGISSKQQIESAVSLCKSAHFTFFGRRAGYAYDWTVYNNYVRVIEYCDNGGFAGGYDKDGEFTWVMDDVPSAFEKTAAAIAEKTISNYNADVVANNGCTLYFPDGV